MKRTAAVVFGWPLRLLGWSARGVARLIAELFHIAIISATAAALVLVLYVQTNTGDLPSLVPLQRYAPPTVSRIYGADGTVISEFGHRRRVYVRIDRVPKLVQQAFVAAEDQRFWEHRGLDLRSIGRALRANLSSAIRGGGLQGASTITQQVAKNLLLSPERSIRRKVREAVLATRIEQAFSKRRILEIYLNAIYLGQRAYGVSAAAQAYFGKPLRDLTLAEAALLAGLAQSPSRHNPARYPKAAAQRRSYVLRRMLQDGYIDRDQHDAAVKTPLQLSPHRYAVRKEGHGYVVDEIRRSLGRAYGINRMRKGGLTIRSSIDHRMQKVGRTVIRRALEAYDRRHGWRGPLLNVIDRGFHADVFSDRTTSADRQEMWRQLLDTVPAPAGIGDWQLALVLSVRRTDAVIGLRNGQRGRIPLKALRWAREQVVKKLKSGREYKTAASQPVRRAGDVLDRGDVILVSRRASDPAGDFRLKQVPEVAGALVALEAKTGRVLAMIGGYSFDRSEFNNATQAWRQPGSAFKPILFATALENGFTPSTLINDAPFRLRYRKVLYRPKNYSGRYHGPTTLRVALERSRNVSSMRLAMRVGIGKIATMARRLNIAPKVPAMPSMVLGSRETTVLRMAAAYASLVNGGRLVRPSVIDRIQDRTGRTIFRQERRTCSYCNDVRWEGQNRPRLTDYRRRVLSAGSAFQVTHMMRGVIQRGTGRRISGLKIPAGGKTGTTNDSMDAWFVGFTPNIVVAIWIGFPRKYSLGKKEEGGKTAAPVFKAFADRAFEGRNVGTFRAPDGLVKVPVNAVTGLPSKAGRVIDDYFKPGRIPTVDGAYVPDGGLMHKPSYLSENLDGVSDRSAATDEDGPEGERGVLKPGSRSVKSKQLSGVEY